MGLSRGFRNTAPASESAIAGPRNREEPVTGILSFCLMPVRLPVRLPVRPVRSLTVCPDRPQLAPTAPIGRPDWPPRPSAPTVRDRLSATGPVCNRLSGPRGMPFSMPFHSDFFIRAEALMDGRKRKILICNVVLNACGRLSCPEITFARFGLSNNNSYIWRWNANNARLCEQKNE